MDRMRTVRMAVVAVAIAVSATGCASEALPTPEPMTPAESVVWTQAFIDGTWASTGLPDDERPQRGAGTAHTDPGEWNGALDDCLTENLPDGENGYGASWGPQGFALTTSSGSDETDPTKARVAYYCVLSNPPAPTAMPGVVSHSQQDYLWQYWNRWTMPCLVAHGYEVTDLPSRADAFADGSMSWSPFFSVVIGTQNIDYQAVIDRFTRQCGPQFGSLQQLLDPFS